MSSAPPAYASPCSPSYTSASATSSSAAFARSSCGTFSPAPIRSSTLAAYSCCSPGSPSSTCRAAASAFVAPTRIARELPRRRLVAKERHATRSIRLDRELGFVRAERLVPLPLRLEELAERVDRERARRIDLHRAPIRLDRFLRLRERRLGPEPSELFVHRRELAAHLRVGDEHRRERLRSAIEERDERLHVPLVAIELREPLGRGVLRRVLVDGHHEDARRAVRVAERRRPDVRRFTEPVCGVRGVTRLVAHLLEQEGVRLGIRRAGVVCVRERLFVVRVRDEALDERVDFAGIHAVPRRYTVSFSRAIRLDHVVRGQARQVTRTGRSGRRCSWRSATGSSCSRGRGRGSAAGAGARGAAAG